MRSLSGQIPVQMLQMLVTKKNKNIFPRYSIVISMTLYGWLFTQPIKCADSENMNNWAGNVPSIVRLERSNQIPFVLRPLYLVTVFWCVSEKINQCGLLAGLHGKEITLPCGATRNPIKCICRHDSINFFLLFVRVDAEAPAFSHSCASLYVCVSPIVRRVRINLLRSPKYVQPVRWRLSITLLHGGQFET